MVGLAVRPDERQLVPLVEVALDHSRGGRRLSRPPRCRTTGQQTHVAAETPERQRTKSRAQDGFDAAFSEAEDYCVDLTDAGNLRKLRDDVCEGNAAIAFPLLLGTTEFDIAPEAYCRSSSAIRSPWPSWSARYWLTLVPWTTLSPRWSAAKGCRAHGQDQSVRPREVKTVLLGNRSHRRAREPAP